MKWRTQVSSKFSRRTFLAGSSISAGVVAMPNLLRAEATVIRWAESVPASHPQVQMAERAAKDVREKSGGRIDLQVFPNSQLGTNKELIEGVASGALQLTTDGAGQLGAFLPQISVLEAPYLWRDAAHLVKVAAAPQFAKLNADLAAKRGIRLLNVTYYGKRHLTSGSRAVNSPADMVGFKLRVPPVDVFRAMAEAWGARATPIAFSELYLALSQGAVDGQENPLPTIQSGKFFEVQKHLVLTEHIITPRIIMANDAFWKGLAASDRDLLQAAFDIAAKWQDQELLAQEAQLVATLKGQGMTVVEPDLAAWRKPVLATVPKQFEDKWGVGTFDALASL
jgi:tripartite ATP-independent transporter DctP family solute receptor